MLEIKRQEIIPADNTIKLIIKATGEVLMPPKVEPKQLKISDQVVQPEEAQITEPLFQIY
jgi:hypothetical protein